MSEPCFICGKPSGREPGPFIPAVLCPECRRDIATNAIDMQAAPGRRPNRVSKLKTRPLPFDGEQ